MPIPGSIARKVTNAVNAAFKKIGTTNGTQLPTTRASKNTEHLAYEYHVASQLARVAEARKKEALAECIKAGLVPNTEKEPRPPGTNETVYSGDTVNITLTVKKGSERVDIDEFCDALADAGVDDKTIKACRDVATKTNRAPHQFSTAILTKDD